MGPYSDITLEECRRNKITRTPCLCDRCEPIPFNQGDPVEERFPLGADVVIVRDKVCTRKMDEDQIDWNIKCFFGEPIIEGAKRRWAFDSHWLEPDWRKAYSDKDMCDQFPDVPPDQLYVPPPDRLATVWWSTDTRPSLMPAGFSEAVSCRDVNSRPTYDLGLSSSPSCYSVKCSSELQPATYHRYTESAGTAPASLFRARTDATDVSSSSASAYSAASYSSLSTPATPYSAASSSPTEAGSRAISMKLSSCQLTPTTDTTPAALPLRASTWTPDAGKGRPGKDLSKRFVSFRGLQGILRRDSAVKEES